MSVDAGKRVRTILFVCDFNGHGGTQTHLMSLLAAIDRSRFRPWLATLNLETDLARRLQADHVEVTNLALTGALRLDTARSVRALAREAGRRSVDLVHGYLFAGNVVAASVSTLSGIPCVTSVRNIDIGARGPHRLASMLAHRKARHVLFNSASVRRQVAPREWIDESRTSIIYNSVVDPKGRAGAREAPAGLPPAGPDAGPTIVCVASLREKKGHGQLLAAFGLVRRRIPGARLLLVGEGPLRATLTLAVERAGLAPAVFFTGHRQDVASILAGCDLFALASLEEGMPNALLEAMAAGLPAVVTDVGGNAEALVDGETGYLVPAGDGDAMASRMIELLMDAERRRRQSEAARRRYEAAFTIERMIADYHAFYDRFAGPAE